MNRTLLRMGVLLVLSGAFSIGAWQGLGGRVHLTRHARPILGPDSGLSMDRSYSGYFGGKYQYAANHHWVAPDQLLLLHATEPNTLKFRAVRIDLATGTESPCEELASLVDERERDRPFFWTVSPDGRKLLTVHPRRIQAIYTVRDLNGVPAQSWTNSWLNSRPVWLTDSLGFIEPLPDDGRRLIRLCRLGTSAAQVLEARLPATPAPATFEGQAIAAVSNFDQAAQAEICAVRMVDGRPVAEQYAIDLPGPLRGSDWAIYPSPNGDRLAWVAFYRQKMPRVAFESSFPFVNLDQPHVACVWVSRTDGTGLRELGRLRPGERVRRLVWMLDGQHVSFVHSQRIWKLRVE